MSDSPQSTDHDESLNPVAMLNHAQQCLGIVANALWSCPAPHGWQGGIFAAAEAIDSRRDDLSPESAHSAIVPIVAIALAGAPECEFFVGVLVRAKCVSEAFRLAVLKLMAANKHAGTRNRVMYHLCGLPPLMRLTLLRCLSAGSLPDDSSRREARRRLADEQQENGRRLEEYLERVRRTP